jgi:hypothetical protein
VHAENKPRESQGIVTLTVKDYASVLLRLNYNMCNLRAVWKSKFIENISQHRSWKLVFGNIFCESMPEASNVFSSKTKFIFECHFPFDERTKNLVI